MTLVAAPPPVSVVRRRTGGRHRRVVVGLVVALLAALAARVLGGDYTVTVPDFLRIVSGDPLTQAPAPITRQQRKEAGVDAKPVDSAAAGQKADGKPGS